MNIFSFQSDALDGYIDYNQLLAIPSHPTASMTMVNMFLQISVFCIRPRYSENIADFHYNMEP